MNALAHTVQESTNPRAVQVLTNEDLLTKVCGCRALIEGLLAECNARHWGAEAALLVGMHDNASDVIIAMQGRME